MQVKTALWKRATAIFLSAVMVFSLLGVTASAEGTMDMSFVFTNTEYEPINTAKKGDTVFSVK